MTKIKFANDETLYAGQVFKMGGDAIVCRFYTRIPAAMNGTTIEVYDGDTVTETYSGYTTVCQIDGMDVILTNSGRVTNLNYDEDELESLRAEKKNIISANCTSAIYYGVNVGDEHYSMEETDQINLQNAYASILAGATSYPYHADGELCRVYTADEITAIATAMTNHKLWHTTYCNHLNAWIKRVTAAADLKDIYYGATLPDDLQTSFEAIVNAAGASAD